MYINLFLYTFSWNPKKDDILLQKRGFGFEKIIKLLHTQKDIRIFREVRPKYEHQHYLLIPYEKHMLRVPCYIEGSTIHLITFYYSRQDTKKFL